jgi:hypothetical protein
MQINARTFPGNEARNARAAALARAIELAATQTQGRGKKATTTTHLKTLVRDDLHWTTIFVDDALTGTSRETVTVYDNGNTRRRGTYPQIAVDRALAGMNLSR